MNFSELPSEWTENDIQGESEYEVSYSDTQRTSYGGGNRVDLIVSGPGSYAQRLNNLNNLKQSDNRALARAALAAVHFYDIDNPDSILDVVQKFPQIEYKNMVALIGAILFYNQYNLSDKMNNINQKDLDIFYNKRFPRIKTEIAIEDLLRYIRLSINTLRLK